MMSSKKESDSICWTDDETELLLNVLLDYKTQCASENFDWVSKKSKFQDIYVNFIEQITVEEELQLENGKTFKEAKKCTKEQIKNKIKSILRNYKHSVDDSRSRGRVVLLYFDLCNEIWGGSPAVFKVINGVETSNIIDISTNIENSIRDCSSSFQEIEDDDYENSQNTRDQTIHKRRELLNTQLNNFKENKMKRKISVDQQMLLVAKEEVEIKKNVAKDGSK